MRDHNRDLGGKMYGFCVQAPNPTVTLIVYMQRNSCACKRTERCHYIVDLGGCMFGVPNQSYRRTWAPLVHHTKTPFLLGVMVTTEKGVRLRYGDTVTDQLLLIHV